MSSPYGEVVQQYFPSPRDARVWLDQCREALGPLEESPLPALLADPRFLSFLRERGSRSPGRLEDLTEHLLRLLRRRVRPDVVAAAAGAFADAQFRAIERSFSIVPVDDPGRRLFERHTVDVILADPTLTEGWFALSSSAEVAVLRRSYPMPYRQTLMDHLLGLFLGTRQVHTITDAADMLCDEHWIAILTGCDDGETTDQLYRALAEMLRDHRDRRYVSRLVELWWRRFSRCTPEEYGLLLRMWPALMILRGVAHRKVFQEFLGLYGNRRDELNRFFWDKALSVEPEGTVRAMEFLVSPPFRSLLSRYRTAGNILRLLVANIFTILMEQEVRSLRIDLYDAVLKMLLQLRLDQPFLDRRATFLAWVREHTASVRIEAELVRIFLFEYIFIATEVVPRARPQQMTRTVGPEHELLVKMVDQVYGDPRRRRAIGKDAIFQPVLRALRDAIWRPVEERFAHRRYLVQQLRSATENIDEEDQAIATLEELAEGELEPFHENFMDFFRRDPDSCAVALAPDHWCRVTFLDALPTVSMALLPVVGTVPILEDTRHDPPGLAYTDGSSIVLMQYVSSFRDQRLPLEENRNLAFYLFIALHEAGHLLGGTFAVDHSLFIASLEKPQLYQYIHNVFEDFRIEAFLVLHQVHPMVRELVENGNTYLTVRNTLQAMEGPAGVVDLLMYIFDEAAGYNTMLRDYPGYSEWISTLLESRLPSGRFPDVRTLAAYGVERLKNLDILNPVSAHMLAREFYDVVRHWPEAITTIGTTAYGPKGFAGGGSAWTPRVQPMNSEEMKAYYDQCNREPEAFLREMELWALLEEVRRRQDSTDSPQPPPDQIDLSTRTRLDDLIAEQQGTDDTVPDMQALYRRAPPRRRRRTIRIHSIDPGTQSRTILSEVHLFPVTAVNAAWMRVFRNWEGISRQVEQMMQHVLPRIHEEAEESLLEGEIDVERLISILASPNPVGSHPFLENWEEQERIFDVEIVIGLDTSGSTAGGILDVEKAFAIIFGRALARLTSRISYLAFNSATSTNVYEAQTLEAVSSFRSEQSNRDGDFIRYVTHRLETSPARQRFFFLISDGRPEAVNYSGQQALNDTLLAMRECRTAGIRLIYLNVDRQEGEYFALFRTEATWAEHFARPEDLLPRIPALVRAIVAAAE